jgi:plasmid stabilization system protein ParE
LAVVRYAPRALEDLSRLIDFALQSEADGGANVGALIHEAVTILGRHPLIGRAAGDDLRELVISRGRTGYVALYRHYPQHAVVMILALRHQREAGYPAE